MNKCIDSKGIHKLCEKDKICNPKTGRCIKPPKKIATIVDIPRTKKTIESFVKDIKNHKTAFDLIEDYKRDDDTNKVIEKLKNYTVDDNLIEKKNTKSIQGFIYERLWDICIKLGITDLTDINTKHGIGNINNKKDATFKNIKKYFDAYIKEGVISGNSGGYSDITFENNKENKRILYLVSVKYIDIKGKNIKDFDIQNLCTIIKDRYEEYIKQNKDDTDMKKYDIKTLLFVKNKKEFITLCEGANKSSNILIKYISPDGNYENVYDLGDLEIHFHKLKKLLELYDYWKDTKCIEAFKSVYLNVKGKMLRPFIPRFHQELFIEKINTLMNTLIHKKNKNILVGAIPRSGKTYIMAGAILQHVKEHTRKEKTYNNYVIITPAPNETLIQYKEAFDNHIDFKRYNIEAGIIKEGKDIKFNENNGKHFVYLISKQRLGNVKGDNVDVDIDDNVYNKNIEKYFGKKNNIKIIFMDEAHFGMTTEIARQIVESLNTNNSVKIYVTATYNKPQKVYAINDKNVIKWDLDDIRMIKDMTTKTKSFREVVKHLSKRFSKNIVKKILRNNGWDWGNSGNYNQSTLNVNNNNNTIIDNIIKQYRYFPEPYMITSVWDEEFFEQQRKLLDDTNVGFNMGKLFQHKTKSSFINEEQLIQLFQYYFGYPATDGDTISSMEYAIQNQYKMKGVLPRIERICNNKCRTLQTPLHKTTQLWFLPHDHIATIMNALLHLLFNKFKKIFKKYMFYIADHQPKIGKDRFPNVENVEYMEKADNIKGEIKNLEEKIRDKQNEAYSKYDGLIIFAGKRLQLGISLENVDIVSLFTNITASDAIYQMIFRSMTEIDDGVVCDGSSYCSNKKYGFMVDLNPQRTIYTLEYFADRLSNKDDAKDSDDDKGRYSIVADLINIDRDKFINKYETDADNSKYVKEFFDKLNSSWEINTENIKAILKEQDIFAENINGLLTDDFDIRRLFNNEKDKDKKAVIIPENVFSSGKRRVKDIYAIHAKQPKINKEISISEMWYDILSESISILSFISSYSNLECIFKEGKIKDFNYEILKIFDELNSDEHLKEIFVYYLKKRVIKKDAISTDELFNMVYNIIRLMNEKPTKPAKQSGGHIEINKIIHMKKQKIYNIKELDKLLEFINANLAPKQTEKKERGEVFTPMKLVNEMLDALPKDVWRNKDYKWLDPAAGMGNFPVAVYMRLMEGLKTEIQNEEERRKHILEKMLYMVELDKANVFMMKKIFCGTTYKLNIFEGSFLDYNTGGSKDKFDIVMGNPPYQNTNEEGERRALHNNLWSVFIDRSFRNFVRDDGYLLFITPYSWMTPSFKHKDIFYNNYIIHLNIMECEKYFEGVGSSFSYYLIRKTSIKKETTVICQYDKKIYESKMLINDIHFLPTLLTDKSLSIINKFYNNKFAKVSFESSSELHHWKNKDLIGECNKTVFKYPILHTSSHKNICSKIKHSLADKNKILLNTSGYLKPIYDAGKYGFTHAQLYILTNNKKYVDVLNSKLYQFIFTICKWSGFNSLSIFKNIPYIEDGSLSDEKLYHLFKLTKDEQSFINNII